jgi:predicted nucleic acid binding AN1-type Zn finger protein
MRSHYSDRNVQILLQHRRVAHSGHFLYACNDEIFCICSFNIRMEDMNYIFLKVCRSGQ